MEETRLQVLLGKLKPQLRHKLGEFDFYMRIADTAELAVALFQRKSLIRRTLLALICI